MMYYGGTFYFASALGIAGVLLIAAAQTTTGSLVDVWKIEGKDDNKYSAHKIIFR